MMATIHPAVEDAAAKVHRHMERMKKPTLRGAAARALGEYDSAPALRKVFEGGLLEFALRTAYKEFDRLGDRVTPRTFEEQVEKLEDQDLESLAADAETDEDAADFFAGLLKAKEREEKRKKAPGKAWDTDSPLLGEALDVRLPVANTGVRKPLREWEADDFGLQADYHAKTGRTHLEKSNIYRSIASTLGDDMLGEAQHRLDAEQRALLLARTRSAADEDSGEGDGPEGMPEAA